MAYITGTALNRSDLLAVLNTQLAAAGWTVDRYIVGDELIAHGPGFGTGDVYIGYKLYTNIGSDVNNFEVKMFTGYSSGNSFDAQPGGSPVSVQCLWDNAMPYWLFINDMRVVLVAKVLTGYEISHLGFMRPYGPNSAFPYAAFVGGNSSLVDTRYSDIGLNHANFNAVYSDECGSYVRSPSGAWLPQATRATTGKAGMYPTAIFNSYGGLNNRIFDNVTVDADGNHFLIPLQPLITSTTENNIFGEIDGCSWLSSFGLSAEDTTTAGADTYVVFPNVFRATFLDFVAIRKDV